MMEKRARKMPLWALVAVSLTGAGCAHTSDATGSLAQMQTQLADAQRRVATAEQKIEALEDKVFLLTDQLESSRVAASRRSALRESTLGASKEAPRRVAADDAPVQLPVVQLRPATTPDPAQVAERNERSDDDGPPGDEIVFAGDALSSDAEHTRLDAASLPVVSTGITPARRTGGAAKTSAPITPITPSGDNLGVAPVPPIARALANASPPAPSVSAPAPTTVNDPLRLYRTSYEALRSGHHADAERGFREFLARFPRHDYADNAQYWLAECFYDRKQYAEAAPEFRAVVSRYPLGNKAPDALLKLAYCLLALGENDKGKEILVQLPTNYPRTEAAHLAEVRLRELHSVTGGTQ